MRYVRAGAWGCGVVLVLVAGVVVGCDDDLVMPPGFETEVLEQLGPGIHLILSAPDMDPVGGGVMHLWIHLKAVKLQGGIASYQGELRFDPDVMSVIGGRVPEGLMGVWHEVEPGRVRFAGVSMEGIGDEAVLVLEVESERVLRSTDFEGVVEEVVSTEEFTEVTREVVKRENPVFTRAFVGTTH